MQMQTSHDDIPAKVKRPKFKIDKSIKKRHRKSVSSALVNTDDNDNRSVGNSKKQLVVFNSGSSDAGLEAPAEPASAGCKSLSVPSFSNSTIQHHSNRVLPSIGAFAVQCAKCFKWRLVPKKEKYEEIRENLLQDPFICEKAQEWHHDVSCDHPADISQDGSRIWAIDKPNIAQPPPGWERILRIRGEGSTKFADVYYAAPSGKRLRSMVEVQKYLLEHPEHVSQGVKMSQFSFQIPRPLQENYVRKRTVRSANPCEMSNEESTRPLEPAEVKPLSWMGSEADTTLQMGRLDSAVLPCELATSQSPREHEHAKWETPSLHPHREHRKRS